LVRSPMVVAVAPGKAQGLRLSGNRRLQKPADLTYVAYARLQKIPLNKSKSCATALC
jgi:hypothetical protein